MSNIIDMSAKTNDGTLRTPEQCLQTCLDDIGKHGAFKKGKKLIVLALDDDDSYYVSFQQAGMKMSECMALCEAAKAIFLDEILTGGERYGRE